MGGLPVRLHAGSSGDAAAMRTAGAEYAALAPVSTAYSTLLRAREEVRCVAMPACRQPCMGCMDGCRHASAMYAAAAGI